MRFLSVYMILLLGLLPGVASAGDVALITRHTEQDSVAVDHEAAAEVVRPVVSVFSAEMGSSRILDTYLSPLYYSGIHASLSWEHQQATGFNPEQWVRQLEFQMDYNLTHNPAGNHDNHSLLVQGRWSLMRRWLDVATEGLQLMVGPETGLRGGMLYSGHNSNNVVSARAQWNVGASAQAVYNLRVGRLPVTLRYQAVLPVAGVFYSPEYGESYYEMYVGNHGGLAHFGWWGNRFDMENLITADLHLGSTVLRLGYRNRFATSWVNNLSVRERNHAFVIGIGGEILSMGYCKTPSVRAKAVSSIY